MEDLKPASQEGNHIVELSSEGVVGDGERRPGRPGRFLSPLSRSVPEGRPRGAGSSTLVAEARVARECFRRDKYPSRGKRYNDSAPRLVAARKCPHRGLPI